MRDGGTLIDACPVKHIEPGALVLVTCVDGRQFSADTIVLCLGPWSGAFLATVFNLHLPLKARASADHSVSALFRLKSPKCATGARVQMRSILYYLLLYAKTTAATSTVCR